MMEVTVGRSPRHTILLEVKHKDWVMQLELTDNETKHLIQCMQELLDMVPVS